jgi:HK97 family phage prohead protease
MWDWLGRMAGVPDTPPRTAAFSSGPMPIDQMFMELRGLTGPVGRAEALSVPAIQKGRNLLCSISTLPMVQKDASNTRVRNPLLEQFDPDIANVVHMAQTIEDLVFDSVAWWRITGFGYDGYPMTVRRLEPSTVSVKPPTGRPLAPLPSGDDPRVGVVYVDGKPVDAREIIRFDSPNPAVLKVCARSIRRAIRFDKAAEKYASNPRPLDYFTPNDGVDPAEDYEIAEILDEWKQSRQSETTAYVPAALTYNTVETATPADLQLVQLQQQVTLDLARALGVDPEDLGVSTTSRSYANIIDRRRDRINDVYAPYMRAITDRLSMPDVTKRGYRVEFDLTDYMKSNPTERWMTYEKGKNLGVYTVDEIRQMEGLPVASQSPAPAPETEAAGVVAASTPALTFNDSGRLTFSDTSHAEFSVDRESRTIEGIAVPYGKIGMYGGMKFRFRRGSLQWSDVSRVKLLRSHDFTQAIGVATELKDSPAGLRAKFKVARGPEGDRALELAEDGVLDGLSVGVDFNAAVDTEQASRGDRSVMDVIRGDLREVSLTPMPAFDDARVTRVAASLTGGTMDETATSGQSPAAGTATETPPAPTTASATELVAAFSAEQREQLRNALGYPDAADPEPRPVVNPTRLTASVNESMPYRFDRRGNLTAGTFDFSTDLHAWFIDRDQAAHDRAMEFIRARFDVATGDVNELNPTQNRPDMYVDQRQFRYPIWDAISKGTLGSITPFTFPKFNSASGLVGNHTEGVEPTSGTLTTTSQTVTPTAVSGKAKITREVWDQGGNPQVSNLIWQKMEQGWYEALEAFAVATLDAATPTAIALTTAAADDALVDELTAALTLLQFVRGGFSMDMAPTQVDLYKKLAAAEDSTGRPLLPPLGPTNAVGTARTRYAGLDVNGVLFTPAWALAASGSVVASSYLFDRAVVHGWASTPQRLDITMTEVAHVYIGLWGYKAAAISDIAGVREITYDPVA